jgi:putative exporter of polyketide antibiotics
MDKPKMILLGSAIIMEIAAVILIVKAISTDSSPTQGLTFLAIGLVFLVIGVTRKPKVVKPDNRPKS